MELRSCIHLHFIQALKGGLVIRTLNVNRGKPMLKFKTLKAVYDTQDENNQNPNEEFEGFLSDSNRVKVERITVNDSDVSEFSCSEDDDGVNSDSDDLGNGMMTLKQIKEKCKAKKRKHSKFGDSRTDELCTSVKQETDEDECDLMQPLITWKSKTSKKVKGKTRRLKNHVCMPPQSDMSIVKVEQIPSDQAFIGDTESLQTLVNVKVEAPEPDCLDNQNTIGDSSLFFDDRVESCGDRQNSTELAAIATECDLDTRASCSDNGNRICLITDSSLIYDDQVDSCGGVSSEATEITTECDSETEALISLTKEPQRSIISEVYHECMENLDSEPVKVVNSQVDSCGALPREVTEIATECFLQPKNLTSDTDKTQRCVFSEASHDCVGYVYSEPVQSISASCADIKKVETAEVEDDKVLDFPVPESEKEGYVDQPLCADIFQEPRLPNSDCSANVSSGYASPSSDHAIPLNIDFSPEVQSSDVAIHGCFQYIESDLGSDACILGNSAKDDLPSFLETIALYTLDGEYSLATNSCFIPSPEDSPTTKEKQSQSSSSAVEERNCFPEMLNCDAREELATSDSDGDCYSKLHPPPQRLLSYRKAISPDSQEKLCKAMESIEIHEEERYRPHKRLCFKQQNGKETKVEKPEKSGRITRISFSVSHKQNIPKPKHEKRNAHANPMPNSPHPSHTVPRFSTGCNSIESCSQSAIAFSQRQMQDIECLTTKLTNELKTMKEIAEDRLYSESSPATSLKYKAHEVKMAIKSATKVEQLANKWLAMMTRDCNRFCKLMRLAEKDFDAPETERLVNKERKKITFADEAGEELCQVKFFEKSLTDISEPVTEKPEALN